jgi:hypothetical protein
MVSAVGNTPHDAHPIAVEVLEVLPLSDGRVLPSQGAHIVPKYGPDGSPFS